MSLESHTHKLCFSFQLKRIGHNFTKWWWLKVQLVCLCMLTGKHSLFEQPLLCEEMDFFYSVCFAGLRKSNTIRKMETKFWKNDVTPLSSCADSNGLKGWLQSWPANRAASTSTVYRMGKASLQERCAKHTWRRECSGSKILYCSPGKEDLHHTVVH